MWSTTHRPWPRLRHPSNRWQNAREPICYVARLLYDRARACSNDTHTSCCPTTFMYHHYHYWEPRHHKHPNVPSVRAGARRKKSKKGTNWLAHKNIENIGEQIMVPDSPRWPGPFPAKQPSRLAWLAFLYVSCSHTKYSVHHRICLQVVRRQRSQCAASSLTDRPHRPLRFPARLTFSSATLGSQSKVWTSLFCKKALFKLSCFIFLNFKTKKEVATQTLIVVDFITS